MNLGEILVTLYKVGTQIRAGLDLFDRIVVPAKEAIDLVTKGEWEDHPVKAKFVALPDEEKAKVDEPEGCGKLTNCRDFSHDQIAALVQTDEKPKPEQKQEPEQKPAPAPKNKAPKTVKAEKKKPNTGAAAGKNTESNTEEKPEDVKQSDDQSGTGEDGDNGDGSKD